MATLFCTLFTRDQTYIAADPCATSVVYSLKARSSASLQVQAGTEISGLYVKRYLEKSFMNISTRCIWQQISRLCTARYVVCDTVKLCYNQFAAKSM
uniref:Uncharacterized protein n=1 Tax=Rhipicephalus zambeziensis TaxID=60191 RepID=A0A224YHI8_9ACAR